MEMQTTKKRLGRGLSALSAQSESPVEAARMAETVKAISAAADAAAADDDKLAIPVFLRRPKEGSAIRSPGEIGLRQFFSPEALASIPEKGNEAATIKAEADARWRGWTPSESQPNRPQLRTFVKAVRSERENAVTTAATKPTAAPKVSPKAPATPAVDQPKESAVRTNAAKKTTKTTTAKKSTTARRAAKPAARAGKAESKSDIVDRMLKSKTGATREALSKATGWPHVNLKVAAERAGKDWKLTEQDGRFQLVAK